MILLGEHLCIVNSLLGPRTVHYREVLQYTHILTSMPLRKLGQVWDHQINSNLFVYVHIDKALQYKHVVNNYVIGGYIRFSMQMA